LFTNSNCYKIIRLDTIKLRYQFIIYETVYDMSHLLNEIYKQLNYSESENLISVDSIIAVENKISEHNYIEKGQWIDLAAYINKEYEDLVRIEKIFFIENNPFVIFSTTQLSASDWHKVYNKIWNMARPRFLFVANDYQVELFDLYKEPAKTINDLTALETVTNINEILRLKNFRRESIESGTVYGDERFASKNIFTDNALISDLKVVRKKLFESGLDNGKLIIAHALIGRSILIRYLEDRAILTQKYFQQIIKDSDEKEEEKNRWETLLNNPINDIGFQDSGIENLFYPRILQSHSFTYTLFDKLGKDFNGDLFPVSDIERNTVNKHHLDIIRNFLIGNIDTDGQHKLFFWAYKFDIIPIELVSSIYEEFYHFENSVENGKKILKDGKGTHYTPASLVEFVLSKVLTAEALSRKPVVIDPACGSGIFLVESFRRMVRYELYKTKKEYLTFKELLHILQNQIRGIELNPEAIKITAFSLYLAFFHYQKPPSIIQKINQGQKLPKLIYYKNSTSKDFNILLCTNAFENESSDIFAEEIVKQRFVKDCADIVVANPPWGAPEKKDTEGQNNIKVIEKWCKEKNKTISDKEPSQAFLWKAEELLKPEGVACMLVSSGVLLKNSDKAKTFKKNWLSTVKLENVTNFIHVRDVFFQKGISPFIAVKFKKQTPTLDDFVDYWTIRKTKNIENNKCAVLDYNDFKFVQYKDITDDIWKILYWGNLKDYIFLNSLKSYNPLYKFMVAEESGRGYELSNQKYDSLWLKNYNVINSRKFNSKYTQKIQTSPPPEKVDFRGKSENMFDGIRTIIKAGITQNCSPKGQIISKTISFPLAFNKSFYGIKLNNKWQNNFPILQGIFWSSLVRYYFFLTASRWAVWHDDILFNEIVNLSINFKTDNIISKQIEELVGKLQNDEFISHSKTSNTKNSEYLFDIKTENLNTLQDLESQLDEAVFDLYNLTPAQRDLIKDRCKYDIDHFYNGTNSIAVQSVEVPNKRFGTYNTLKNNELTELEQYIKLFLEYWADYLEDDEEFNWQWHTSLENGMLALIFTLQPKGENIKYAFNQDIEKQWKTVLSELEVNTRTKISEKIYVEGLVMSVTDEQLIIIKRNEKRLWTRTEARIDAESMSVKATNYSQNKDEQINSKPL